MTTIYEQATKPRQGIRASRTSPVIVATDGHDQSNHAMLMGVFSPAETMHCAS